MSPTFSELRALRQLLHLRRLGRHLPLEWSLLLLLPLVQVIPLETMGITALPHMVSTSEDREVLTPVTISTLLDLPLPSS